MTRAPDRADGGWEIAVIRRSRRGYTLTLCEFEGRSWVVATDDGRPVYWLRIETVLAYLTEHCGYPRDLRLEFQD